MNPEDIPYRSAAGIEQAEPVSIRDEKEYSTLREVHRNFRREMESLYRDFNAFEDKDVDRQIAARKVAYKILEPLLNQLESTIEEIKLKQGGQ